MFLKQLKVRQRQKTTASLTEVKATVICTEQYLPSNRGVVLEKEKNNPKKTQTQILKKQPLPTQGMFIRVQFPLELLKRRTSKVIMLNCTD